MFYITPIIFVVLIWRITEIKSIKRFDTYCNVTNYPFYLYLEMVKGNETDLCAASLITLNSALTIDKCCQMMEGRKNFAYLEYKSTTEKFKEKRDVSPIPKLSEHEKFCLINFTEFNINQVEVVPLAWTTTVNTLLNVHNICKTNTVQLIGETKQKNSFFDGFHCVKRELHPIKNCYKEMQEHPSFPYDEKTMFCHYHARVTDKSCRTLPGSPILYHGELIGMESSFLDEEDSNCLNKYSVAIRGDIAYYSVQNIKKDAALGLRSNGNRINSYTFYIITLLLMVLMY